MSRAAGPPGARAGRSRLRRRAALREAAYLLALLVTAGVLYAALVLVPSKLQTQALRAEHDRVAGEVHELRRSIAVLKRDTQALREDPWVVERALRGRLGYLRPGERVFRAGS